MTAPLLSEQQIQALALQGLTLQLTPQYDPTGQAFGAQMAQYATQETIAAAIRQAVKLAGEEAARVCDERKAAWSEDPPDGTERERGWQADEAGYCADAIRARL